MKTQPVFNKMENQLVIIILFSTFSAFGWIIKGIYSHHNDAKSKNKDLDIKKLSLQEEQLRKVRGVVFSKLYTNIGGRSFHLFMWPYSAKFWCWVTVSLSCFFSSHTCTNKPLMCSQSVPYSCACCSMFITKVSYPNVVVMLTCRYMTFWFHCKFFIPMGDLNIQTSLNMILWRLWKPLAIHDVKYAFRKAGWLFMVSF